MGVLELRLRAPPGRLGSHTANRRRSRRSHVARRPRIRPPQGSDDLGMQVTKLLRLHGSIEPRLPGREVYRDLAADPSDICRSIFARRRASRVVPQSRSSASSFVWLPADEKRMRPTDRVQEVPVHEIEYEDLVQNPASVMLGVCGFLGVGFDERMLYLEGADRSAIYGGDHHALVKSERIVLAKPPCGGSPSSPSETRSAAMCRVGRRSSTDAGPRVQPVAAEEAGQPGRLERYSDVLKYRTLRAMDFMIIVIFCLCSAEVFWRSTAI